MSGEEDGCASDEDDEDDADCEVEEADKDEEEALEEEEKNELEVDDEEDDDGEEGDDDDDDASDDTDTAVDGARVAVEVGAINSFQWYTKRPVKEETIEEAILLERREYKVVSRRKTNEYSSLAPIARTMSPYSRIT